MSLDELFYKDPEFDSEEFIERANLMVKKVLNAVTLNELEKVRHFMSEELYQKLQLEINQTISNGRRLVYDEVNVNCKLAGAKEDDDYYYVNVSCSCKYLKYYLSLSTGTLVEGSDKDRIYTSMKILFQRKKGTIRGDVARCLGCGVTLNINDNGKCPNCGRIYDLDEFDYIIKEMS